MWVSRDKADNGFTGRGWRSVTEQVDRNTGDTNGTFSVTGALKRGACCWDFFARGVVSAGSIMSALEAGIVEWVSHGEARGAATVLRCAACTVCTSPVLCTWMVLCTSCCTVYHIVSSLVLFPLYYFFRRVLLTHAER